MTTKLGHPYMLRCSTAASSDLDVISDAVDEAVLIIANLAWSRHRGFTEVRKEFMVKQSAVPPGGQFVLPTQGAEPLLSFRRAPAFRGPYLERGTKSAAFLGSVHIIANVPLNATGVQIPVDISNLEAQKTAYRYASVTKADLRTGASGVRPPSDEGGLFAPFIPQRFYINFDQHLAKNLSLIDQLKADGFNTLHPIPPHNNFTIFQQVIDKIISAGTTKTLTAVAQQANAYLSISNLLNWKTAHEPDGNSGPENATRAGYHLTYQMDRYHPMSLVLNCQDYNFSTCVKETAIVLQYQRHMVSCVEYECNPDFGHWL
ncbi:uncharacterized protein BJ212DRAFT_1587472 [Suillus subaureus]|uniref:Uncharacterized protein n=1 Tax=Suillus subaureus TaxID=48587 RepID=A0A9P7EC92_9AGAM|nr:uncharacterized protein BJ212DRAFT_1587472 [Suillus subaureus]KAG1816720.1 hypothetical protein BJ212DRAFT_1587472 [Suillus subaureus]